MSGWAVSLCLCIICVGLCGVERWSQVCCSELYKCKILYQTERRYKINLLLVCVCVCVFSQ